MATVTSGDWEVIAVRFGTRTATKAKVYLNYQIYREPDSEIEMDYYFWIARNGDRTVLIDTGFTPLAARRRNRSLLISPATALAELGIDPAGIDTTIISHLHYDHAGNIDLAPRSRVVVARKEIDFWHSEVSKRRLFASAVDAEDIASVDAALATERAAVVDGDAEIAPGLRVLEVGGHTPGQLVVGVATPLGEVLLASDAIHYYEEFDRDRPFVELDDLSDVFAGFDRVRTLVNDGAILVPGHDPDVMRRFPVLPGARPDLAVLIGAKEK